MSKILRRPMFRGGPVDSRGTGITSGLMDGGRVGYNQGKLVLGGDLYGKEDYTKFIKNYANNLNKNTALYKSIFTKNEDGEVVIDDDSKYSYENMFGQATGKSEKPESIFTNVDPLLDSTSTLLPPPGGTKALGTALKSDILSNLKESKQFDTSSVPRGPQELGMTSREQTDDIIMPLPDDPQGNNEQVTDIDARTLMKENAELFKELLGEANEKKLKDARISDVSDYLLKFFEGSQKEGATVGSSAADVAAFATSRDSRTERAKAGIEKQDQTAMALAINDYVAGKRSKEQLDMLSKKLDINLKNKLDSIDYSAAVATSAEKGKSLTKLVGESGEDTTSKKIESATRQYADNRGLPIPQSITSKEIKGDDTTPLVSDTTTLLVEENKNQIFIDKSTKEVFQVVEDPDNPGKFLKKRLY